jgi:hypothetical protein
MNIYFINKPTYEIENMNLYVIEVENAKKIKS